MVDLGDIELLLETGRNKGREARSVLEKAREAKGLSLEEAATLLTVEDGDLLREILKAAAEVKEKTFGKRVVLFAPLYISNYCTNGCLYCGFRAGSPAGRLALTPEDAVREAKALEARGLKRVLLVTGEDPRFGLDHITSCVRAIYEKTGIRIIHVNAPPMDTGSFRILKEAGVGVYQSFQETYHEPTYRAMHPSGMKKDYCWRLSTMDRAMEAGFDDVGIGPLLGLYDFRYDCLSTIAHSLYLYERYGAHAHTISIPRLRPAEGGSLDKVPCPVTDEDLKRAVAVFRLCVPTAGVVVSTRESLELRRALIRVGATQLSAASRTNPGGYTGTGKTSLEQFSTLDPSSLEEVMRSIIEEGFIPSLCTTCYRTGRTGGDFTEKTLSGGMEKLCTANAILTLKEYIEDFSNGIRGDLEKTLMSSIEEIKDPNLREAVIKKLKEIEDGKRDLFF